MKGTKYILFFLLGGLLLSFQKDERVKVRFKKGEVLINDIAWSKFNDVGTKTFAQTLSGEAYVIVTLLKYGTKKYDANGREINHLYSEIKFDSDELTSFEVDLDVGEVFRQFYRYKVLNNDVFDSEVAKEFKKQLEDNVSERRFQTK